MDLAWREWATEEAQGTLGASGFQLRRVIDEVVSRSDGNMKSGEEFDDRLLFIQNVRNAINPLSYAGEYQHPDKKRLLEQYAEGHADDPTRLLWAYPLAMQAVEQEGKSWHDWPTDTETANSLALEYANSYWDMSPTVEHALIAALTYAEARNYMLAVRDKRIGLTALLHRNEPWKVAGLMFLRASARALLRALVCGVVALMVFSAKNEMGTALATFIVLFVGLSAWHFAQVAPDRAHERRLDELAVDLVTVANQARQPVVPAALLELVKGTTAKGALWPTGLWALLVRAHARCAWQLDRPHT